MNVKELFDKADGGTLTYEQFVTAAGTAKFVDLTEGNYVSKNKYDSDIQDRDSQITSLTDTIQARDTDLQNLQTTLKDAGDIEALKTASKELGELQKKYDKETKDYQTKLSQQAYEFAVKEFANSKQFTSKAAKRDFTQAMIAKKLQFEDGKLIGAEDFATLYAKDNDDAFAKKTDPKPQFTQSTESKEPKKLTLTQLMQMKNENPDAVVDI